MGSEKLAWRAGLPLLHPKALVLQDSEEPAKNIRKKKPFCEHAWLLEKRPVGASTNRSCRGPGV